MKIQHKIIAVPLAVMLLVGALSIIIIESYLERQLISQTKNELKSFAYAALEALKTVESVQSFEATEAIDAINSFESFEAAEALEEINQKYLRESFQGLAQGFTRAADMRITYIDANGAVLGDSNLSMNQLKHAENHLDRSEVQAALTNNVGISQRTSKTLNTEFLYVAVRSSDHAHMEDLTDLAHPLIARASRPLSSINAAIMDLRITMLSMGMGSLFVVLLLGLFGSRLLTKTVNREQQLLEDRVTSRTTEISILQTFGGLLNACSTLEEAGQVMNNVIPKLLPKFKGSISIIKSSRNRLDLVTSWGGEWAGMERYAPSECWALRKGHQHIAIEHGIHTFCNHWTESPQQQTLCIPLLAQGETIGVLHFVMEEESQSEDCQHIWNSIAEQAGLTLANIQLRDSLREQAIRDPLTGLFNRRYMLEALDQAHSRAERVNSSIAILMIDLDHFKQFNDNFGHDAGDHVLKAVATVMQDSIRQEDIACRYGGEEFCIVCPFTDEQQALLIAERIGNGIRTLDINMNQLSLGTVTTSIGIALFPSSANTIEDTIKAADEALYLAKQNGRDRAEVAPSSVIESSDSNRQTLEMKSA